MRRLRLVLHGLRGLVRRPRELVLSRRVSHARTGGLVVHLGGLAHSGLGLVKCLSGVMHSVGGFLAPRAQAVAPVVRFADVVQEGAHALVRFLGPHGGVDVVVDIAAELLER